MLRELSKLNKDKQRNLSPIQKEIKETEDKKKHLENVLGNWGSAARAAKFLKKRVGTGINYMKENETNELKEGDIYKN
jgi:hypothetical protein